MRRLRLAAAMVTLLGALTAQALAQSPNSPSPASEAAFSKQTVLLSAPTSRGSGSAFGIAQLEGDVLVVQAAGDGLRIRSNYLVWLARSNKDATALGYAQFNRSSRVLAGGIQNLPASLQDARYVVVTREPRGQPHRQLRRIRPGRVVLRSSALLTTTAVAP